MNAEVFGKVTFLKGVKEENLPKMVRKTVSADTGNGVKGQQKLSRSVQAKEVQYGE